ncbi:MAG TPA: DUF1326 domain-containing protein [Geminicoccaceae bacterium]
MTWQIAGKSTELCSCKMMCPCWLGPDGEPDQEWCSGAFGFDIEQGESDGVDLSGTRVALAADWPGNFFHGQGTGKLYLDAGASEEQRRELEAIFSGKKGGMFEAVFGGVISSWLPARVTNVDIKWDEAPSVTVGDVASATLTPLEDGAGNETRMAGAVAQAALQIDGMQLANARGSRWTDPDLRSWEGDSGTLHRFRWSG